MSGCAAISGTSDIQASLFREAALWMFWWSLNVVSPEASSFWPSAEALATLFTPTFLLGNDFYWFYGHDIFSSFAEVCCHGWCTSFKTDEAPWAAASLSRRQPAFKTASSFCCIFIWDKHCRRSKDRRSDGPKMTKWEGSLAVRNVNYSATPSSGRMVEFMENNWAEVWLK